MPSSNPDPEVLDPAEDPDQTTIEDHLDADQSVDPVETPADLDALDDLALDREDPADGLAGQTAKVGDTLDLGASVGFVRLPDGTVVTSRGTYTAQHPGEHALIVTVTEDGESVTVETLVEVTK